MSSDSIRPRFRKLRTALEALPEVQEPPKSTFRILQRARTEQVWNRFLTYFLDPSQPHGFDIELLKVFLDRAIEHGGIDLNYYHRHFEDVEVDSEVSSSEGNRPDIVIRVPEQWFVCIECKVDAPEGENQTPRYVEDAEIGGEAKSDYPEDGHHYLFISKESTSDASAEEFNNIYWHHLVDAFREVLWESRGKYPNRSVSQLDDFLTTVADITNMTDDKYTEIQREKVQLLGDYWDDITELFEAAEKLRKQSIDTWPEEFASRVEESGLWGDEWHIREDEYGCLFRDGWCLDDEQQPVTDHNKTRGNSGHRLHFIHLIRNESSFREGKLSFILRSPTNNDLRDEFNRLFNSGARQDRLKPLLDERDIQNQGYQRDYTEKIYDVDQSGLPGTYFDTLVTAFEEHLAVAEVVDEIHQEALSNISQED